MRHNIKLIQTKDAAGAPIKGLWESDAVKLESVPGGWECSVPLRYIGTSIYLEFRPEKLGGKFKIIGTYSTKDDCCVVAERLQAASHVVRWKHLYGSENIPTTVVEWSEASEEIAQTANGTPPTRPESDFTPTAKPFFS